MHGGGVAESVRGDATLLERGAMAGRFLDDQCEPKRDTVAGERRSAQIGEDSFKADCGSEPEAKTSP